MADIAAAVGILDVYGQILIGRKRDDSIGLIRGKWHLPGETLHEGENGPEGLTRGFMEETGLEIEVCKLIGTGRSERVARIEWYLCKPKDYRPAEEIIVRPGSDLVEAKWVRREDVPYECDPVVIGFWPDEMREFFRYW
jgi:ADP-ribose pyrophosphatase YjhB (NUDIX family)